ncbi:MAG TPA: DUF3467 domain-containing protein [Rhodanobacteraceae bacterium]|nr:DUF3467 domain-containing protein [Rhodanobacteraceae bacterium]
MDHEETSASDPESGKEGRYANYFEVGHNVFEFVLDFGQLYRGDTAARIHTRIIAGPAYAQALGRVLQAALEEYERKFGPIGEPGAPEAADELVLVAGKEPDRPEPAAPPPTTAAGIEMSTAQSTSGQSTSGGTPPPASVGDEIQKLRDKVALDEAAIGEQTRTLDAEKQKLTFADATLADIDGAADEYAAAVGDIQQQWDDLKTYLKMHNESIDAVVDADKARAIEKLVGDYDKATATLSTTLDQALTAQTAAATKRDKAVRDAAGLETAFADIKGYKAALDAWLARAGELRTQIDALDPVHQGARAYFLLKELDKQLSAKSSIDDAATYRTELEANLSDRLKSTDELATATQAATAADAAAAAAKTAYQDQVGKRSDTLLAAMDDLDKADEDPPAPPAAAA